MSLEPATHRRASTFVVVLGSSLVVTVIGLAAVLAVRIERRATEGSADVVTARFYAQSAIELGLHWVSSDPNWRTNRVNGAWATGRAIGTGQFTLLGVDPNDANLANSPTDPINLTGIGMEGEAKYELQVAMEAEVPALTCLEAAVHAGSGLVFTGATVTANQMLSTNGDSTASSSTVAAAVEAAGSINGATYAGTTTAGAAGRKLPDASVFDYYVTNGTAIDYATIPVSGAAATIENVVISPSSNPYGAMTNPEGIYVISPGGQKLIIRNTRIVGTLVVINPTADSAVSDSVAWEPAVSNYPVLLVSGSFTFAMSSASLSETNLGVNFNPAGTGFQGSVDADTADVYRSVIDGLVYTAASANVYNETTIDGGLVVGGTLLCTAASGTIAPRFGYRAKYYNNPPPGFTDTPRMVVSKGSWKQIVN